VTMHFRPQKWTTTTVIQVELNEPVARTVDIDVVYTNDGATCTEWLQHEGSGSSLGFDLEYRPQFRRGGPQNRVALIQLATATSCLLFQVKHHHGPLPNALVEVLKSCAIRKAGVGILDDANKLHRDCGADIIGRVEIAEVAYEFGVKAATPSLANLSAAILGLELAKPKNITLSNWEQTPLTELQLQYAALDAWVGYAMLVALEEIGGPATQNNLSTNAAFVQLRVQRAQRKREAILQRGKRGREESPPLAPIRQISATKVTRTEVPATLPQDSHRKKKARHTYFALEEEDCDEVRVVSVKHRAESAVKGPLSSLTLDTTVSRKLKKKKKGLKSKKKKARTRKGQGSPS